jgi:hypothetical protein
MIVAIQEEVSMPTRNRSRYVRSTLSSILIGLATGLEPLQLRLEQQFRAIKTLTPDDFPEDLQDDYERLMDALSIEEKNEMLGSFPQRLKECLTTQHS